MNIAMDCCEITPFYKWANNCSVPEHSPHLEKWVCADMHTYSMHTYLDWRARIERLPPRGLRDRLLTDVVVGGLQPKILYQGSASSICFSLTTQVWNPRLLIDLVLLASKSFIASDFSFFSVTMCKLIEVLHKKKWGSVNLSLNIYWLARTN